MCSVPLRSGEEKVESPSSHARFMHAENDIAGTVRLIIMADERRHPMTQAAKKTVLKRALALNPVNRAELIEALFRSFGRQSSARNDALWADEAESRLNAYFSGKITTDTPKAVFGRIDKR